MNQILTDEELWDIHCKEDDTVFAYGRGVISAYETKLREQNDPIYQLRCSDGAWIDQNEQSYKYNLEHGHTVRKLYEHPAPSAPEGMVLVPIEIIDRFPQLNPSNYDHEGVCYLNAWGVELVLSAARSE